MTVHQHRSGNLQADRRAEYAEALAEGGEPAAAADLMRQALDLAPHWTLAFVRLAHFLESDRRPDEAADALREALRLDPADRYGASLVLARLHRAPVPAAPPSAFVETLFDDYAPRFERSLRERLAYRAPEALFALLGETRPNGSTGVRVLDLGCGTGLMGALLAPGASELIGLDLSGGMLAEARAKGIYHRLVQADLTRSPLPDGPFGLVTAADVLNYVGDLAPLFGKIRDVLSPTGLFAFTVEAAADENTPFELTGTLRYAHGGRRLASLLGEAGLALQAHRRATLREDRGVDLEGHLVIAALRREQAPAPVGEP